MHRQAVLVFFTFREFLHQVFAQFFTRAFCLGAIGKRAVNAECAVNWERIHWIGHGLEFSIDKGASQVSCRRNPASSEAILAIAAPLAFGGAHPTIRMGRYIRTAFGNSAAR